MDDFWTALEQLDKRSKSSYVYRRPQSDSDAYFPRIERITGDLLEDAPPHTPRMEVVAGVLTGGMMAEVNVIKTDHPGINMALASVARVPPSKMVGAVLGFEDIEARVPRLARLDIETTGQPDFFYRGFELYFRRYLEHVRRRCRAQRPTTTRPSDAVSCLYEMAATADTLDAPDGRLWNRWIRGVGCWADRAIEGGHIRHLYYAGRYFHAAAQSAPSSTPTVSGHLPAREPRLFPLDDFDPAKLI
jgi:hypothetical protein